MTLKNKIKIIKLVATDCDGVLTDGGMYLSDTGEELKRFNVHDGQGFIILRNAGIKTAIITSSVNSSVKIRADKLGVNDIIMGCVDKLSALTELCEKYNIQLSEISYIGDDINDVPALKACGFSCAPQNAMKCAKDAADYITRLPGGDGCFREMVDIICKLEIR